MNRIVKTIIEKYGLQEHPEGGYFKEKYRSDSFVKSPVNAEKRSAVTDIYFLLCKGQISRFHKVLHDEIWHFYHGAPLRLIEYREEEIKETVLESKIGSEFRATIKGGSYQAAESLGDYSLVGCVVAPGFDFKDFSFMNSEADQEKLKKIYPDFCRFI